MADFSDVRLSLEERWGKHRVIPLCRKILERIEGIGAANAQRLEVARLAEFAGKKDVDEDVIVALNILVGCRPPLLDIAALFLDSNGDEYDLDGEEVDDLIESGEIIHPVSGDTVENADEKTIVYYTISDCISGRVRA